MRFLLVGYTGLEANIGCQATSNGLLRLLESATPHFIDRLPHTYVSLEVSRYFLGRSSPSNQKTKKSKFLFSKKGPSSELISIDDLAELIKETDFYLSSKIELADKVYINGEGIIHHGQLLGFSLLIIARIAELMGKEVHFVNSSFQEEDHNILKVVLGNAHSVTVRDSRSFKYLESINIPSTQGADCAFLAEYAGTSAPPCLPREIPIENSCMITGGVVAKGDEILHLAESLRDVGFSPFYFMAAPTDLRVLPACQQANLPVVYLNTVPWPTIVEYIKQVKAIISGRHHINIFSIIADKPFVPLESNTWKIEGTLDLFDIPFKVALSASDVINSLSEIDTNYEHYTKRLASLKVKAIELAKRNFI